MSIARMIMNKLPVPLRKLAMGGFHYAQRLHLWRIVMRETRPVDKASRKALYTSLWRAPITAFGRFDRWENPRLISPATLEVKNYGRFVCRPNMDDLFHILPAAQPGVLRAIEANLKPGMTFIDAGANIGFFTVLGARLVGAGGQVIAIEMIPEVSAILRRHLQMNDISNVIVVEKALSNRDGDEILAHVPRNHAGQATIVAEQIRDYAMDEVRVSTTTLDCLTTGMDRIDFMKVDLEGAEAIAFEGARQTLQRTAAFVFETRPDDPQSNRVIELVREGGFTLSAIDRYNTLAKRP